MKLNILVIFLCIFVKSSFTYEHYSKNLFQKEEELLVQLKSYSSALQKQLDKFKKDLSYIKEEQEKAQKDVSAYIQNPINAFSMIRRLNINLKNHFNEIYKDSALKGVLSKMEDIIDGENYPTEEELADSALAFLRLQETYNLDASELSSGIIGGIKTSEEMSWDDCFHIGEQLYEFGDHNHTQEWLREAYQKFYPKINNDEESIEILETMANMTLDIYDVDTTKNITETILKHEPNHFTANIMKELIETLPKNYKDSVEKPEYKPSVYLSPQGFRTYEAVCRDDLKRTPREEKDLYCMYATYDNPFLKLAPFQLEFLSLEPRIVLYHNVLYDSEIQYLKDKSEKVIKRSKVGAGPDETTVRSKVRTSHSTFYNYHGDDFLKNLLLRVEDMTRQTIAGSELIQVANYGMGGHYEPHYDCFGPNQKTYVNWEKDGDRISTAMFYASDVELGGSTAFPHLKLNVKPQKGSLVFWYNLHTSGNPDFRSLHAGCPVIKGSKWIFNIWMRINPQIFHRKCESEDDTWKSEKFFDAALMG